MRCLCIVFLDDRWRLNYLFIELVFILNFMLLWMIIVGCKIYFLIISYELFFFNFNGGCLMFGMIGKKIMYMNIINGKNWMLF